MPLIIDVQSRVCSRQELPKAHTAKRWQFSKKSPISSPQHNIASLEAESPDQGLLYISNACIYNILLACYLLKYPLAFDQF